MNTMVRVSSNALFTILNGPLGPVRAVAFHPSRQLLCTGGDDYKIKVWGEVPVMCSSRLRQLNFRKTSDRKIGSVSLLYMATWITSEQFSFIMKCRGLYALASESLALRSRPTTSYRSQLPTTKPFEFGTARLGTV